MKLAAATRIAAAALVIALGATAAIAQSPPRPAQPAPSGADAVDARRVFSAIVKENADKVLSTLVIEEIEGHDLRATLTAFGQHLMGVYMSPTLIGIYRIAVTEANRFPDLVKSFYEQGPGRATSRLAEVLEVASKRGEIRTEDCARAAGHFVGMIRDNLHLQVVLGLRAAPSKKEMREAVGSAVEIFLNGVRPGRRK